MISWNIPNWITVILMVLGFYVVVALGTQFVISARGGAPEGLPGSDSKAGLMGIFGTALAPAG